MREDVFSIEMGLPQDFQPPSWFVGHKKLIVQEEPGCGVKLVR